MTNTENMTENIIIRPASENDITAIAAIYDTIIDQNTTGWQKGIYPTAATVRTALAAADMYVAELSGRIVAAARLNHEQVDVYANCPWLFPATPEQVFVIHTLVVDPAYSGHGIAGKMLAFYEDMARHLNCTVLRLDTNAINTPARRMYAHLGYREAGILPCDFNGIPGIDLVCLEKSL